MLCNTNRRILGVLVILLICMFMLFGFLFIKKPNSTASYSVTLEPLSHSNIYTKAPEFTSYVNKSKSGFEYFKSFADTGVNEEFDASSSDATFEQVEATTATGANKRLYEIADENFIVYYGSDRVNPLLPLAIANVETPGRANHDVTWSALFPSKIVPIDLLDTMDVTTVISNPEYFKPLSAEYSTRDRGALQMSPTYGTGLKEYNALMSGTEKEKLSKVSTANYSSWVSGASDKPGDRFKVSDVCLRLGGSMQQAIQFMIRNDYKPKSDLHLIAMCAMHHHNSGVWYFNDKNKSVGRWLSGAKAYEWSTVISSDAMLKALSDYAKSHDDAYFIDSKQAHSIYDSVYSTPMSNYATKDIVCTYPIKVLYAYIKLCMLYTR